jgi:hypothetical protein
MTVASAQTAHLRARVHAASVGRARCIRSSKYMHACTKYLHKHLRGEPLTPVYPLTPIYVCVAVGGAKSRPERRLLEAVAE